MDYDLFRVLLNRRHPSVIYSGQPRFLSSEDDQFVFVNNKPVSMRGWEDYIQFAFSESEEEVELGNWVITSSFDQRTDQEIKPTKGTEKEMFLVF